MVFQRVVQQLAVGENIHTSLLSPLINIVHHLTTIGKFQCTCSLVYTNAFVKLLIALLDGDSLRISSALGLTTNFVGVD